MTDTHQSLDPDLKNAPDVYMNEYLITNAAKNPIVTTKGVAACTAVTLYDPQTKTGMLAHLHPSTKLDDALDTMRYEFTGRQIDLSRLEVRILGASSAGEDVRVAQISEWANANGMKIVQKDVQVPGRSLDLAFDLRSGGVKPFKPSQTSDYVSEMKWKEINEETGPLTLKRDGSSLPPVSSIFPGRPPER